MPSSVPRLFAVVAALLLLSGCLASAPSSPTSSPVPPADHTARSPTSAAVIPPFPSVAPDAASTSGTLQPGQAAVVSDDQGPALLVRVRDVRQLTAVPGLSPASDGDVFLDATVDVDVLRDVSALPLAWKTFGAQDVSSATWPADGLDLQGLTPGVQSGHLGFEAPGAGQVLWRILNTVPSGSAQFELRPAPSVASPEPAASAAPGDWTGLRWSAPSVLPGSADGSALAGAIVPWQGGYVAVGSVSGATSRAAAWLSPDGVTWSLTFTDDPGQGHSAIQFVRVIGGVLVGIGTSGVDHCSAPGEGMTCDPLPVAIWTSTDGRTWTRRTTPSSFGGASVADVASGPSDGMVIGDTGWDHPWIWTSPDGASWTREPMPAGVFAGAHLRRVAAWGSGWILVGSVGGLESRCCVNSGPTGQPAAWYSSDGITWTRATTRTPVTGRGELETLDAGLAGLVAMEEVGGASSGSSILWTSTDGRTWTHAPMSGAQQSPLRSFASDGTHILWEGWAASGPLPLFVSGDGVSWRALNIGGATETAPLGDNSSGPQVRTATLMPNGLVAIGDDGTTGTGVIWTVRAVTAP